MTQKNYVILGGGGSFGIHAAKYLLAHADPLGVYAIGRMPIRHEAFMLDVAQDQRWRSRIYHIVQDFAALMEFLDGIKPEVIINFAAQGEGAVSWQNSWRFFDTNATGLARLTEALTHRPWLERFIQIGTSELYGSVSWAAKETDPIKPSSPYAASKAAADMHLMSIAQVLKFPMNIIRPSNCYGSGQLLHRIVPKTIVTILKGGKVPLHGGGRAEKSYMHSIDLARAIHLVSEHAPLGEVYNVGPPSPMAIKWLVRAITGIMGVEFDDVVEMTDDRPGQDARYWLSSEKIRRDTGWEQRIGIDDGIREVVDWARKNFDVLKDWPMTYEMRP